MTWKELAAAIERQAENVQNQHVKVVLQPYQADKNGDRVFYVSFIKTVMATEFGNFLSEPGEPLLKID